MTMMISIIMIMMMTKYVVQSTVWSWARRRGRCWAAGTPPPSYRSGGCSLLMVEADRSKLLGDKPLNIKLSEAKLSKMLKAKELATRVPLAATPRKIRP